LRRVHPNSLASITFLLLFLKVPQNGSNWANKTRLSKQPAEPVVGIVCDSAARQVAVRGGAVQERGGGGMV